MIFLSLIIPRPTFRGLDLVALALGNPLHVIIGEAIAPYLTRRAYEVEHDGKVHDVFPCRVPDGIGARIPIGGYELALFTRDDQLVVAVPAAVNELARKSLAGMLAAGTCKYGGVGPGPDGFHGSFGLYSFVPEPGVSWTLKLFGAQIGFAFTEPSESG